MIRLNIGCGKRKFEGWTGVDLDEAADVVSDIRKLPFEDDSVEEAMAIHCLEHLHLYDALPALIEWKRVLKPGKWLSVEVPCLDKIIDGINRQLNGKVMLQGLYGDIKKSRDDPNQIHRWCYTINHLTALFKEAGFEQVRLEAPVFHFAARDMRVCGAKPNG